MFPFRPIKRTIVIFLPALLFPFVGAAQPQPEANSSLFPVLQIQAASESEQNGENDRESVFRQAIDEFIDDFSTKHHVDPTQLQAIFNRVTLNQTAIRLMTPSKGKQNKNWQTYRRQMIEPVRIAAGVRFWNRYEASLKKAENQYGVPADIIVGILGMESDYGKDTGNFRTVDTLATLAFNYPETRNQSERKAFFRHELEALLLLAQETGTDPLNFYGSYAGAIGFPQFMPGSIRAYAVDFDEDGRIDLENSAVDAIGSIARFLHQHGWRRGEPILFPARQLAGCSLPDELFKSGLNAKYTVKQLNERCIATDTDVPVHLRFGLIDLPNGTAPPEYFIGTGNFFAITRYNRSYFYAVSVVLLGQAIQEEKNVSKTTIP